jgi:hypothetical protein
MNTKYQRLVDKLQASTKERKITWVEGSAKNEYKAVIGKNSVSIKYNPLTKESIIEEEAKGYVTMAIWNSKGVMIDVMKEGVDYYAFSLYSLYNSARRAYLKVEETVDEMISELG